MFQSRSLSFKIVLDLEKVGKVNLIDDSTDNLVVQAEPSEQRGTSPLVFGFLIARLAQSDPRNSFL